MKNIILGFVFLILSFLFGYLFIKSITYKEKPTDCKVLKGYLTETVHKHNTEENFILILSDKKGRIFNMEVSPSTYYIANKDKQVCLMLSEQDITKKYPNKGIPLFYIFSSIICCILCIVYFVNYNMRD